MTDITVTATLKSIVCADCGIIFYVAKSWVTQRREDHQGFCCPNKHPLSFPAETEAEKMRRERDRLAQQIAQRDDEIAHQRRMREHAEQRASAFKGVATRLKNRAAAGVCPCCNRTFVQLQRHMRSKHPDFGSEDARSTALVAIAGGKS